MKNPTILQLIGNKSIENISIIDIQEKFKNITASQASITLYISNTDRNAKKIDKFIVKNFCDNLISQITQKTGGLTMYKATGYYANSIGLIMREKIKILNIQFFQKITQQEFWEIIDKYLIYAKIGNQECLMLVLNQDANLIMV